MTILGELAVWVALFLAVWAAAAPLAGLTLSRHELVESGARAVYATTAMVVLASCALWRALLAHDFSLEYVAAHTALNLPPIYSIVAAWAGPPGTTLSLALALGLCAAISIRHERKDADRRAVIVSVFGAALTITLGILNFAANPFVGIEWVPGDGRGLEPALQNPWAVLHAPTMVAGCATAAVPFAYAVSAVVSRRADGAWLSVVQRWSLASWTLLTVGLAAGTRWLYIEPAWRGAWARPGLEAAAALPWALVTATLWRCARPAPESPGDRALVAMAAAGFLASILVAGAFRQSGSNGVHGIIRAPGSGWALVMIALLSALALYGSLGRVPSGGGERRATRHPSPGAYVAYFGALLLLAATAATRSWMSETTELRPGGAVELRDPSGAPWRFVSQGVSRDQGVNYISTGVALEAWRDTRRVGIVSTEERQYFDGAQRPTFDPSVEPGIRSLPEFDLYVALVDVRRETARVRIGFNRLAPLLWIGWGLLGLGGLAAGLSALHRAEPASRGPAT